jgi:hypothetical protein
MESTRTHRSILIEMRYTARNVPECREKWMIRHAWNKTTRGEAIGDGRRTIGEAGIEVIPDGPVELAVEFGRVDGGMRFGAEHQKEGEEGRERRLIE